MRTIFVATLLVWAGCGSDVGVGGKLVGANCSVDAQCDHRCVLNDHFPNGLCTVSCNSDLDCPNGTSCVDEAGGICEVQCGYVGGNCSQFGLGVACDAQDRKGAQGQAQVCRTP